LLINYWGTSNTKKVLLYLSTATAKVYVIRIMKLVITWDNEDTYFKQTTRLGKLGTMNEDRPQKLIQMQKWVTKEIK